LARRGHRTHRRQCPLTAGRLEHLFNEVAAQPVSMREGYLPASAADVDLQEDVRSLLRAMEESALGAGTGRLRAPDRPRRMERPARRSHRLLHRQSTSAGGAR
jgi:hypothetical protein